MKTCVTLRTCANVNVYTIVTRSTILARFTKTVVDNCTHQYMQNNVQHGLSQNLSDNVKKLLSVNVSPKYNGNIQFPYMVITVASDITVHNRQWQSNVNTLIMNVTKDLRSWFRLTTWTASFTWYKFTKTMRIKGLVDLSVCESTLCSNMLRKI